MALAIKSNMAGYIANIRRGVMFDDAATVLDELVQNAERAKATEINIVDAAEQRFLEIMGRVENILKLPAHTINISSISLDRINEDGTTLSHLSKTLDGVCDPKENKIYLNRKSINFKEFKPAEVGMPILSNGDWVMLIATANCVCHELTHLLYGTMDGSVLHECGTSSTFKQYAAALDKIANNEVETKDESTVLF